MFCFNQFGDCEGVLLCPGNVHSADRWKEVLEPIVKRYKNKKNRKYFRGDVAFAKPEIYDYLEENGYLYAIRLPANEILYEKIRHLLTRPVGINRGEWLPRLNGTKGSYSQEWDLSAKPEGMTHFHNGRGTAELWIKEGKYALNWTRLSCKRFRSN